MLIKKRTQFSINSNVVWYEFYDLQNIFIIINHIGDLTQFNILSISFFFIIKLNSYLLNQILCLEVSKYSHLYLY